MLIIFVLSVSIVDLQEFENENTIVDQTNSGSRSEFPIFRAISPTPNTCHTLSNTENNLDNRILSNIVNQNEVRLDETCTREIVSIFIHFSQFVHFADESHFRIRK